MDAHGYQLAGNARSAHPDFFPSLIGIDPNQVNLNARDVYFDRFELTDRRISSLSVSRWVNYDSVAPGSTGIADPILGVRRPDGGSYYIPYSELYEIAAFNHDDDTIEMLEALSVKQRRHA